MFFPLQTAPFPRFSGVKSQEEKIRVGFIGAGGVAQRHARMLSEFNDVEIASVCGSSPGSGSARDFSKNHGGKLYPDFKTMLDSENLDAVYVSVPPNAHGPAERAVIRKGLPMMVEKPQDNDGSVAESLAKEIDEEGILATVAYQKRFNQNVDRVKEILGTGSRWQGVIRWLDKVPPVKWWKPEEQIVEQVTHLIDLARVFFGEVTSVNARKTRINNPEKPDETVEGYVGTLTFESGETLHLEATSQLEKLYESSVRLSNAQMELDLQDKRLVVRQAGKDPQEIPTPNEYAKDIDRHFIDAVKGKKPHPSLVTYGEALRSHWVALALAQSIREGRPVQLSVQR